MTLAECIFSIEAALAGRPLGGMDVALCEDSKTVVFEFRAEGGEWDSRSFDLPLPIAFAEFDASLYEAAAREIMQSTKH